MGPTRAAALIPVPASVNRPCRHGRREEPLFKGLRQERGDAREFRCGRSDPHSRNGIVRPVHTERLNLQDGVIGRRRFGVALTGRAHPEGVPLAGDAASVALDLLAEFDTGHQRGPREGERDAGQEAIDEPSRQLESLNVFHDRILAVSHSDTPRRVQILSKPSSKLALAGSVHE